MAYIAFLKRLQFMRCTWVIPAVFCAMALSAQSGGGPQNLGVTAQASGDRIEIKQNAIGQPGTQLTCMASSSTGNASDLTLFAASPFIN